MLVYIKNIKFLFDVNVIWVENVIVNVILFTWKRIVLR